MFLLSLLACGLVLIMLHQSALNEAISLITIALLSMALLFDLCRKKDLKSVNKPIAASYVLRLFVMILGVYGLVSIPMSGDDTERFFDIAVDLSNGIERATAGGKNMFSLLMGGLFSVFGVSRLLGTYCVLMFSIGSFIVLNKTLLTVGLSKSRRKLIVGIVCFLPFYLCLSTIFLRETIIILLLGLSVLFFVMWFEKPNGGYWFFFLSGGFALAASAFHGACGTIIVGYVLVVLLFDRKSRKYKMKGKNLVAAAVFLLAFLTVILLYGDVFFFKLMKVESLSEISSGTGSGNSTYAQYVGDSRTVLRMAIYSVPRILYFLFSPFPWQWRGLRDILAFLGSSLFYLVTGINALLAIRRNNPYKNLIIALLIVALCVVFVFSWGVTNTGTAIRHRDKFILLFAAILALSPSRAYLKRYPLQ